MMPFRMGRVCAPVSLILVLFTLSRCAKAPVCEPFAFDRPAGVKPPPVYEDNCMSAAKVALGRRLFYEKRLSKNEQQSCSSCHMQRYAFSDHRQRAVGTTGQIHPRNAPGLTNVGYFRTYTWAAPRLNRLVNQAINPLFAADGPESIVELGVSRMEDVVAARLSDDAGYRAMFLAAFGDSRIDIPRVAMALEAFETTLLSFRSPHDLGEMDESARRGEVVFHSAGCAACHGGPNFNERSGATSMDSHFHNVGLYNVAGKGDYPDYHLHGVAASKMVQGLHAFTGNAADRGRFRTPSLRNVELTGPYMHDGSIATLVEVIEHFDQGGRNVLNGPFAGDGRLNPNRDPLIRPLKLTVQQKSDLLAFLHSLTDHSFVTNPAFSDPAFTP